VIGLITCAVAGQRVGQIEELLLRGALRPDDLREGFVRAAEVAEDRIRRSASQLLGSRAVERLDQRVGRASDRVVQLTIDQLGSLLGHERVERQHPQVLIEAGGSQAVTCDVAGLAPPLDGRQAASVEEPETGVVGMAFGGASVDLESGGHVDPVVGRLGCLPFDPFPPAHDAGA
jgi:hypothetical protein